MTRSQRIAAAKAYTEANGGLEALAKNYKIHLEEGYLEASVYDAWSKVVFDTPQIDGEQWASKKRIWAFNSQGIATTDF